MAARLSQPIEEPQRRPPGRLRYTTPELGSLQRNVLTGEILGPHEPPIMPLTEDQLEATTVNGRFNWNPQRQEICLLFAEGQSYSRIARRTGVSRRTLAAWMQHAEFRSEVDRLSKELQEQILQFGIAHRVQRVKALDDRWSRMHDVIEQRSEHVNAHPDEYADVPGANTGIVVTTQKVIGQGPNAREITVSQVDTELLGEIRATEKQAAQEMGQWTDKSELTVLPKAYIGIDLDRV